MSERENSVLEEAQNLVYGERNVDYGHPYDDFKRTAMIWSAVLGCPISARQVALCMIGVKISRECNAPKRDNRVDMAGYAETLNRVDTKEKEFLARVAATQVKVNDQETKNRLNPTFNQKEEGHRSLISNDTTPVTDTQSKGSP